jgi:uncharacterized protein YegP (UPF0339 family)
MTPRFVLSGSTATRFRFVLKAGNNETILASERYKTRAGAQKGIASVRANAADDARYVRKVAANGAPMFNLRAANNEVIGTSGMYSSTEAREVGIASVKANGPAAPLDDRST